jgi:hypothetical protein
MPRPAVTQFRLEKIIASLGPTVTLLKDLNDAFGPPFVQHIINIIEASINVVQVMHSGVGYSSNPPDVVECEMEQKQLYSAYGKYPSSPVCNYPPPHQV